MENTEKAKELIKRAIEIAKQKNITDRSQLIEIIKKEIIDELGIDLPDGVESSVIAIDMGVLEDYEKLVGYGVPKNNPRDIVDMLAKFDFVGSIYFSVCVILDKIKRFNLEQDSGFAEEFIKSVNECAIENKFSVLGVEIQQSYKNSGSYFPYKSSGEILVFAESVTNYMGLAIEKAKDSNMAPLDSKLFIEKACRNFIYQKLDMEERIDGVAQLVGGLIFSKSYLLTDEKVEKLLSKTKSIISSSGVNKKDIDSVLGIPLSSNEEKISYVAFCYAKLCKQYNSGAIGANVYDSLYKEIKEAISE